MKFEPSEDQQLLRDSTRAFLAAECPLAKTRPTIEHDSRGFDASTWVRFAEMGYLGLHLPEAVGGQGLGTIELAIVLEEMGRACAPGPYLDVVLAVTLLDNAGGQQRLESDVGAGRKLVTIARDDSPYAGDAEPAARYEQGRVRGKKYFVPFAADADALLVATPQGIALAEAPFSTTPLPTLDP